MILGLDVERVDAYDARPCESGVGLLHRDVAAKGLLLETRRPP